MMACFSPTYRASKNIGRYTFASYQRIQTLTNVRSSTHTDSFSENSKPQDIFNDDRNSKHIFKNISLITPKLFTKFFFNDLKLKFVEEKKTSKAGIELLRNINSNYDYWMVGNNQALLLYYRLEMMLQRISYMKTIGLDSKQKLRQLQKKPPLLLFTFSDCSYTGKLIYLRGLLHKDQQEFIHLFYPVTNKITADKITIQNGVKRVEDELKIKQPAAIRELLHMPCFFMDPSTLTDIQHMFIHKHSMPYYYSVDKHTVQVLPPICNLAKLGLKPDKHFSNSANNAMMASLPTYSCADLLDNSYPINNGRGTPECLSTFLSRAEFEEEKDRTGGQPLKGRRGFNVPPRQY